MLCCVFCCPQVSAPVLVPIRIFAENYAKPGRFAQTTVYGVPMAMFAVLAVAGTVYLVHFARRYRRRLQQGSGYVPRSGPLPAARTRGGGVGYENCCCWGWQGGGVGVVTRNSSVALLLHWNCTLCGAGLRVVTPALSLCTCCGILLSCVQAT